MGLTTAALIERNPELWRAATVHPFLEGARDGSLDEQEFARWLEQDHLFVVALTRAWGRMLTTAPLEDFELVSDGIGAFTAELAWFAALATDRDLGLDAQPVADAAAYIAYLGDVAEAAYAVSITAMWAVEAAYLHAWRGALVGSKNYAPIVEHWANDGFASFVGRLADAADRELAAAPSARVDAEDAFRRVLAHECAFWALGSAA